MPNLLIFFLFCFFLSTCGEARIRKEPFAFTTSLYENRSLNTVFLAHAGDTCSILLYKRIHNVLFFLPINGYSKDELADIANQKMVRYKNTLRIGDLLWNVLFFFTFLTYTIEVETCDTGMIAIARHELDFLKDSARDKEKVERYKKELEETKENLQRIMEHANLSQKDTDESAKLSTIRKSINSEANASNSESPDKNSNSDIPTIKNYKNLILKQFLEDNQPYSVLFDSGNAKLLESEKKKLDSYVKNFMDGSKNQASQKILLIGHTDWTGNKKQNFELSSERAISVSQYLIKMGISADKIHLTFSGGLWPDNLEDKMAKKWNRRVDLLLLE